MTTQAHQPTAYSVALLASRWGCSSGHIYKMIHRGELRSFQIGKLMRIAAGEVERIEGCGGSSYTEASGAPSDGMAEKPSVTRFGPVIVARPRDALKTV